VSSVGALLFSDFLFPFEAISLLLLVAVIGGVMLTRHVREGSSSRVS
jgi:NADH:ubiquinone oxidoreductase subunit 6 (subunit J)